ncbi:unnamed protein product [Moneuplotes crassus]|uniref:C2H2-type domain-containing protein n=1 Tax=Euplotes crassus TaxID=5936 RepID=A0AAD1Y5E3_EUPCR|nr:unnamed protein product [Moneuplotes crassus]
MLNSIIWLKELNLLALNQLIMNYCCSRISDSQGEEPNISAKTNSFIVIRDKSEDLEKKSSKTTQACSQTSEKQQETSCCDSTPEVHYKTYKQIKEASLKQDPDISKAQIYENLLKPFKHEKKMVTTPLTGRETTLYVCKYGDCNKAYTKIWNLVDHARMHEGIKPYSCRICHQSFTQKGNLKKHLKLHDFPTVKERRRFQCKICHKKYTQSYNLKSHMKIHE